MSHDFKRSRMLLAQIQVLFTLHTGLALHAALGALPAYVSRGHGKGKRSGVNVKALNKMRRHDMKPLPRGGGKQEAARRVASAAYPMCSSL